MIPEAVVSGQRAERPRSASSEVRFARSLRDKQETQTASPFLPQNRGNASRWRAKNTPITRPSPDSVPEGNVGSSEPLLHGAGGKGEGTIRTFARSRGGGVTGGAFYDNDGAGISGSRTRGGRIWRSPPSFRGLSRRTGGDDSPTVDSSVRWNRQDVSGQTQGSAPRKLRGFGVRHGECVGDLLARFGSRGPGVDCRLRCPCRGSRFPP